jgi:hypothetical protein
MVRQYDPGVDVEGGLPAYGAHCFAKRVDLRHQQAGAAVAQIHREEIGGTRDPIASVIRHRARMPEDGTLGRAQGGASRRAARTGGGLRAALPARSLLAQAIPKASVGRMQSAILLVLSHPSETRRQLKSFIINRAPAAEGGLHPPYVIVRLQQLQLDRAEPIPNAAESKPSPLRPRSKGNTARNS